MLIAAEYLGSVGVGVTAPQFFRANDGEVYVVKLRNNQLGSKVLASEFFAAKFGALIDLCFPSSQIIEINEETLRKNRTLTTLFANQGKHFASHYLTGANYVDRHNLHKAANVSQMAGVLLFDHMFHNADRAYNRKNLLIRKENGLYKIYAIDNSHLFRSGRWTIEGIEKLKMKIKVYYQYSFGLLLRNYLTVQDFIPYVEKVQNINDQTIATILEEIPREWLPNELDRQAFNSFVKVRCTLAEQIGEELCRYIQRKHGKIALFSPIFT
jgi:hypothetical protein